MTLGEMWDDSGTTPCAPGCGRTCAGSAAERSGQAVATPLSPASSKALRLPLCLALLCRVFVRVLASFMNTASR